MVLACPLGIEGESELFVPIELIASLGESVVAVTRVGPTACHVCSVGGDLVGDHTFPHVCGVGQPQVFLGRHVAQHVGAVPTDHRRADGARDMVVSRSDVGHQRAERVERRFVADLLLLADIHFDLVQRNVSGSLYHHLHVAFPGTFRQLPECLQFGELRLVTRVRDGSRAQRISQRNSDVIRSENLEQLVVMFVERVLLTV